MEQIFPRCTTGAEAFQRLEPRACSPHLDQPRLVSVPSSMHPAGQLRAVRKSWIPPLPQTTTVLAIGFLAGCLIYTPMITVVGPHIPPEYRESVQIIVGLFKHGILLILGFYFAKVVNAGQQDMANKAIEAAAAATPVDAAGRP